MLDQVRTALAEIVKAYGDTRIHYCRLEVAALDGGRCALSGTVLDRATLAEMMAALAARFPVVAFDATAVQLLREGDRQRLTVATNVTGLYAQPSFLAEMLSQLLNGRPVELLQTQERWAFVSVPAEAGGTAGYLGWAYQPYLTEAPAPAATHIVCAPVSLLRADPEDAAALVTRVLGGTEVAGERWMNPPPDTHDISDVDFNRRRTLAPYHRVTLAGGLTGWLPAADLRSLDAMPTNEATRRSQVVADALRFVGVPYLWGGSTAFGIDCSGFTRLLHGLIGVHLPRDADMQLETGAPVETPFQPGDLLFFGEGDRRKITHVGMSLGGWQMIHSSRSRNGVYVDDVPAIAHLRESFVGTRTFLANGR